MSCLFLKLPGIVLKMASLVKDGTFRKPPYKTFIIPADELVQVVAKVCFLLLITCELLFLFKFMSMRYIAR